MSQQAKDNELYLVRFYDAPVNLVWDAWTDPAQAAHWWGPRGFTITTHGKDLRPGGYWHYTMHGPDGVDYPNKTMYLEVEEHAKLVYDHGGYDDRPPLFRVTVLFSEEAGKTKMAMTMALASKEAAEQTHQFIKQVGGYSTWDRLGEYLEKSSSQKEIFIISRSFDAPIDVVFDAWSDPAQMVQWTAPIGMNMAFLEADIRTGGKSFYYMGNEHLKMYGLVNYLKVEKPNTLIYTQQFCDAERNISRHPMAPTWPETMLTQVSLTAVANNKTLVRIRWEVTGPATAEEMNTFIQGRNGMTQGWTGSLDKLEQYLLSIS